MPMKVKFNQIFFRDLTPFKDKVIRIMLLSQLLGIELDENRVMRKLFPDFDAKMSGYFDSWIEDEKESSGYPLQMVFKFLQVFHIDLYTLLQVEYK